MVRHSAAKLRVPLSAGNSFSRSKTAVRALQLKREYSYWHIIYWYRSSYRGLGPNRLSKVQVVVCSSFLTAPSDSSTNLTCFLVTISLVPLMLCSTSLVVTRSLISFGSVDTTWIGY